jgi:hypothetical protein
VYAAGEASTARVPREIGELVVSLPNPVSREGAKQKLATLLKQNPGVFLRREVENLLVDAISMYRMRSCDRKMVVELITRAKAAIRSTREDATPN